jgi:hypothetical protein
MAGVNAILGWIRTVFAYLNAAMATYAHPPIP